MHNQLGDHRVIGRPGAIAGQQCAFQPYAAAARGRHGAQRAACWPGAAFGLLHFRIEAELYRKALRLRRRSAEAEIGKAFALRQGELDADEIQPGDFLSHRVLHLQARIDLEEIELAISPQQELHGRQAGQAGGAADGQRMFQRLLAQGGVESWRRGDLHQFLVAALQRAFPLPQMAHAALAVADQLNFNMPGALDHGFGVKPAIAKGRVGFRGATGEGLGQFGGLVDPAHAAPTTAGNRLKHDRQAARLVIEKAQRRLGIVQDLTARDHRHPGLLRQSAGAGLVAQARQGLRGGTDKVQAGFSHRLGKAGIFAQEAVARMQMAAALYPGDINQRLAVQIGGHPAGLQAHQRIELIGPGRHLIIGRIHADGVPANFPRGAGDAQGNLAAIGNEKLIQAHLFQLRHTAIGRLAHLLPNAEHRRIFPAVRGSECRRRALALPSRLPSFADSHPADPQPARRTPAG